MPQVELPPAQPIKSDIELFAKAYFNIDLTKYQVGVIEAASRGKRVAHSRQMGRTTANKVIRAYLREGILPGGRVRLPKHPLPPQDKTKLKGLSQHGRVLAMIKRPGGAYNFELSRFALKYTSVISDLRKEGHNIVADRQYNKHGKPTNTWRYRIGGK